MQKLSHLIQNVIGQIGHKIVVYWLMTADSSDVKEPEEVRFQQNSKGRVYDDRLGPCYSPYIGPDLITVLRCRPMGCGESHSLMTVIALDLLL